MLHFADLSRETWTGGLRKVDLAAGTWEPRWRAHLRASPGLPNATLADMLAAVEECPGILVFVPVNSERRLFVREC